MPASHSQPSTLTPSQIAALAEPMLLPGETVPDELWERLAVYVELLQRWNQRINLTAVRNAAEFAHVHIAESLRSAQHLPPGILHLLDYGSGAGLPGIPIQLLRPEIAVTLAESQAKKASFLREAVRTLGLKQTEVYAGRVEALPPEQQWDAVSLRAVDKMALALTQAAVRIRPGGRCLVLTTEQQEAATRGLLPDFAWQAPLALPGSRQRVVLLGQKPGHAS
jgi:16S rRNA (guanine527-N7)-methyltransferase